MRETRLMMGMPVSVDVVDAQATAGTLAMVFDYFQSIDERFSTYKPNSEISQINQGLLKLEDASDDMRLIFTLAEQTRQETFGYFDIARSGLMDPASPGTAGTRTAPTSSWIDPSGIVKGWAIQQAAELLRREGFQNYYVDAGGDVQVAGLNEHGEPWRAGVRSPFNMQDIVKVVTLTDCGIATSGTYARGQHIYNPFSPSTTLDEIVSLTVIGPNVYEADRFATAAFAMGHPGIYFIEALDGFEGYMIDAHGIATKTTGFEGYVWHEPAGAPVH